MVVSGIEGGDVAVGLKLGAGSAGAASPAGEAKPAGGEGDDETSQMER